MEIININTDRVLETLQMKLNSNNFGCYLKKEITYYNTPFDFCYTFVVYMKRKADFFFFYDFLPSNYLIQRNASIALQIIQDNEIYTGGTILEDFVAEDIFQAFFKKWVSIILP